MTTLLSHEARAPPVPPDPGLTQAVHVHTHTGMRRILPLLLLVVTCRRNAEIAHHPAMYPYLGFGRADCFAGRSLERGVPATAIPDSADVTRGSWLVLDTLVGADTAWRRSGEPATFIERRDSLDSWWGDWRPTTHDSIAIDEGTYPPVHWRLEVEAGALRGEGTMRSDAEVNDVASGTHWSVWLRRISCSAVPLGAPAR
jgi:hypothetical protein